MRQFWSSLSIAVTLVALGASFGVGQSEETQPPALAAMPPNTWVKLDPGHNPVGRSYSGIAGAYGAGVIFYFGGGHGSHLGNDVELFHVPRATWRQATEAEKPTPGTPAWVITNGWGTTEITLTGRPYTEHTYQLTCYDPARRLFVSALTSGTWTFDPASARWTRLTPTRPESTDVHTKMLVFDPSLGAPLYLATTGERRGVYRFEYAGNRWVSTGSIPREMSWAYIFSTYDSDRRLHVISHSTTGVWTYDVRGNRWERITSSPPELAGVHSFAYDPEHRIVLFATRESLADSQDVQVGLWTYQADGNHWERLQAAGGPPRGRSTAMWGTLAYAPELRGFVFVNTVSAGGGGVGGVTETWAYRYAP